MKEQFGPPYTQALPLLVGAFLILSIGCSPFQRSSDRSPNQGVKSIPSEIVYLHEVSYPGESLVLIAAWYTGDESNWEQLLLYNREIVPTALHPGDVVRIPGKLATRTEPLQEEFVASFIRKAAQEKQEGKYVYDEDAPEGVGLDSLAKTDPERKEQITEEFVREALD